MDEEALPYCTCTAICECANITFDEWLEQIYFPSDSAETLIEV